MSFIKSPVLTIFIICIATIYVLFSIKENVMLIKAELNEVNSQIQYETDTIHLFKAEFAYLTSPERLRELNDQYIRLTEIKLDQITTDPVSMHTMATSHTAANTKAQSIKTATAVKWRYKQPPSKYLSSAPSKKKTHKRHIAHH